MQTPVWVDRLSHAAPTGFFNSFTLHRPENSNSSRRPSRCSARAIPAHVSPKTVILAAGMLRFLIWIVLLPCTVALAADDDDRTELQISFDPYLSIETGADLMASTVSIVALGEDWTFGHLENRPAVRRPVRAVWTLAFDMPIAVWFSVQLHEIYGHGGRAREFGSTAGVHVGSPWERRSSYATFGAEGLSNDDLLRVYTGGSEANGFAATLLEREMVGGRKMRPLEFLYVAANRFTASAYVLHTTPDPADDPEGFWREWSGGGDVAHYLGYYHASQFGDAGITPDAVPVEIEDHYDRLTRQAYWNALDPGAWLSLFTAWRSVIRGDERSRLPMPRIGGRRFLPVFSCDWLPRGSAASLELVFSAPIETRGGNPARWFSFTVRQGRGYDGGIGALGAATESFAHPGPFRLGGDVEVWDRPGRNPGGGFRVRASTVQGKLKGFFFDVGAKTVGHWPGRPAESGLFLRVGGRFAL